MVNLNLINANAYQSLIPQSNRPLKDKYSFKGGFKSALIDKFSGNNCNWCFKKIEDPAISLLTVNMISMFIPRVLIDSCRTRDAGIETGLYETLSTIANYALPGAIAYGVASMYGKSPLGLKKTNSWADNKSINTLSQIYRKNSGSEPFAEYILKNVQFCRGTKFKSINGIVNEDKLSEHIKELTSIINKPNDNSNKELKESVKGLSEKIGESIGAVDKIKIGDLNTTLPKLLENTVYLGRQFKGVDESGIENIVKKLRKINHTKAAVSLAVVCGIGFGLQFVIRWMTKLRTGKDGFVGYKDFASDKKTKDKKAKENKSNASNHSNSSPAFKGKIIPDMEFDSKMASTDQLKAIYLIGGIGKALASRSWDEFREIATKFSFAYFNFLIIPGLIGTLAAKAMKNNKVFNNYKLVMNQETTPNSLSENIKSKFKHFNNLRHLSIKSFNEIEAYSKYKAHKYVFSNKVKENENLTSKKLDDKQILQKLKDSKILGDSSLGKLSKEIGSLEGEKKAKAIENAIKKELQGIRNIASFSKITYSFLTLGIAINIINLHITNKKRAKALEAKKLKELNNDKFQTTNNVNNQNININKGIDNKSKQLFASFTSN